MASEKLSMGRKMKKKKEREIKHHDKRNHELCENDEKSNKLEGNEKYKPADEKKRKREKRRNHNIGEAVQTHVKVGNSIIEAKENYRSKSVRKRKSKVKRGTLDGISDQLGTNTEDGLHEQNDGVAHNSQLSKIENSREADDETEIRTRKSEKARKKKKIDPDTSMEDEKLPEKTTEAVYHLSSGDEDCSKGMKKWVTEYYQSRPGMKELQQRIDEFITAHEAQLEQERKEREAKAAEGGWTVVVHHKGRKKTTDSESGITVGSVAQAVVEDKMAKKKHKDVGLDFYRFQRREARRNEILMLQSKFEQDRKRIQQLRAARKFQPY